MSHRNTHATPAQPGSAFFVRTQDGRPPIQDGHSEAKGRPLRYDQYQVPDALFDAISADEKLPPPPLEPPTEWVWEPPPGEAPGEEDRATAWQRKRRRILDDRLRGLDARVLRDLLKFQRGIRYIRWRPEKAQAEQLGVSVRTIRMSRRRLSLRGFIRIIPLDGPDLDDPRNRTGYRIALLWIEGIPEDVKKAPDIDRRPPSERKVWTRSEGDGMQPVASPPPCLFDPPVASDPVQPVASKYGAGASNRENPKNERETPSSSPRAPACEPAGVPGPDDDDSSLRSRGGEPGPVPAIAEAVAIAEAYLGQAVADEIRSDAGRLDRQLSGRWDWFVTGLCVAVVAKRAVARGQRKPIGNPVRYAMGCVNHPKTGYRAIGVDQVGRVAVADVKGRIAAARAAPARSGPKPTASELEPPSAEDVEQFRAWYRGDAGPHMIPMGKASLLAAGLFEGSTDDGPAPI